jgi:hypothetical protein
MKKGFIYVILISIIIVVSLYYDSDKRYVIKNNIKVQSSKLSVSENNENNNIVKSIFIYKNGQKIELDANKDKYINELINNAVRDIDGQVNRYIDSGFLNNYEKNGSVIEITYNKPQSFEYPIADGKKASEQYSHLSIILNYENLGNDNILILSENGVFGCSESSKNLETTIGSYK